MCRILPLKYLYYLLFELFPKWKQLRFYPIRLHYKYYLSVKRYEYYHEYYEKVVAKIKNTDFNDEKVKNVIIAYIDGYDKRKDEMINVLFPHLNDIDEYGGNYYGTLIGSVYPEAMMEFDRNELLTY